VEFTAERVAEIAGRPAAKLTRRDMALALLRLPAADALGSLPTLRRGMVAAGNPMSVPFWDSAEATLAKITDRAATMEDMRLWLEATGTEPTRVIGLHEWEEPAERSSLQEEMHTRLVHYLEDLVADGEIDPDQLALGEAEARKDYTTLQERWMVTPLPDGRVPMSVLLDEQDEQLFADWAATAAVALESLDELLESAARRPMPTGELTAAGTRLRGYIARAGWPGQMLVAFSGLSEATLPGDDLEMWLTLAASVAAPQGEVMSAEDKEFARAMEWADDEDAGGDDEPDELSAAMAAVCALEHFDWLAVMDALVTGGPGTPASAADLARYVRDYDPPQAPSDGDLAEFGSMTGEDYDDLSIEGLFLHITAMWSVLGAIDEDDRLTALGWWGLPEAMRRAWAEG
jgi:hypothetical protein